MLITALRPRLMVLLVSIGLPAVQAASTDSVPAEQWKSTGLDLLERVNAVRAAPRNCGEKLYPAAAPLAWSDRLAQAAFDHSRDMVMHNTLSHAGSDGSDLGARVSRTGYRWQAIGENIASGQVEVEKTLAGWLSSPGHCANIMNSQFTEMGAAYAMGEQGSAAIYWTQVFATAP
ncbi:CAP domain-containing protein [Serpens gallinarum]|uniref:CAP domain-containing protein n=1 Tax=Serpens gallinarum TaxID=2763075 RepID=A0ABR8TR95_9PSED|nr:CAP domain-containing protein [Serpens gallinarum]MBD7977804.1 CAP domain-containing protein [Serpens gallinarum]